MRRAPGLLRPRFAPTFAAGGGGPVGASIRFDNAVRVESASGSAALNDATSFTILGFLKTDGIAADVTVIQGRDDVLGDLFQVRARDGTTPGNSYLTFRFYGNDGSSTGSNVWFVEMAPGPFMILVDRTGTGGSDFARAIIYEHGGTDSGTINLPAGNFHFGPVGGTPSYLFGVGPNGGSGGSVWLDDVAILKDLLPDSTQRAAFFAGTTTAADFADDAILLLSCDGTIGEAVADDDPGRVNAGGHAGAAGIDTSTGLIGAGVAEYDTPLA
jgi:hypothetical protein